MKIKTFMAHPLMKPRGKIERAFGERLMLKGTRSASSKWAPVRRPYPPGVHGPTKRSRPTPYGLQLREKQKAKVIYGLGERQFRKYFDEAQRAKGDTGQKLVAMLETRLDNVVYRLGFAPSRRAARQLVSHGHILVNGKRATIASITVHPNDAISFREKSKGSPVFTLLAETLSKHQTPAWLMLKPEDASGKVLGAPQGEDLKQNFDTKPIIEFYSR